jgi:peptide/nickel transport system substrate-binding protein
MIVFRRRLVFWLIKAYFKKWGKVFFLSFFAGLLIFFVLIQTSYFVLSKIPIQKKTTIGLVGAYQLDSLPQEISEKISRGLTKVDEKGEVRPDIAQKWEIKENGKLYTFYLQKNIHFHDGQEVTTNNLTYNFADVTIDKVDRYTINYHLKEAYSPFLVTVSRPVLKNNGTGIGDFRIENVNLNGKFISSLSLVSAKNRFLVENYSFYPSQEALKIALTLGEIKKADGLTTLEFKDTTLSAFRNLRVMKKTKENTLVTLFYNNRDKDLSDKKIRSGLTYALPDSFADGDRTVLPYNKKSQFYNTDLPERTQDLEHAKDLLKPDEDATQSAVQKVTIKTLAKYKNTAVAIAAAWRKAGVETNLEVVNSVPADFQIYLGDINLPNDPDQYTLWHSDQVNNITHFKNLRIDKLLEDGRKSINMNVRKKIYDDFQKYLQDESPAAFLYFPYVYEVSRK